MKLSAVNRQFGKAAQDNPALQVRPVVQVQVEAFRQIFAPIRDILQYDPVYAGQDISIADQIQELRHMCLEAQVAHTTKDTQVKADRVQLLNVLQSVLECVQETADNSDIYLLDFKDPQELSEVEHVICEAAEIHAGFLGNCDIALAMEDVADQIVAAKARLWEPDSNAEQPHMNEFDMDAAAANDALLLDRIA